MTISSTTLRQRFNGDGSTKTFAIPFSYPGSPYTLASSEVKVYVRDETDPNNITETLKTNPTHYTISGTNVVFGTAPTTSQKVLIIRQVALTQTLDLISNGQFLPDDQEGQFDRLTMAVQQLNEAIGRAPKFKVTSLTTGMEFPEPVANYGLGWDATGTQLVSYLRDIDALNNHINDTTDAHLASSIGYSSTGMVSATDVDAALDYLSPKVTGTRASPIAVNSGGISPANTTVKEIIFIQGSGGAVDVSGSPQIGAGTRAGQSLTLIARSDTNTVLLEDGTGLSLNGAWLGQADSALDLVWDGSNWVEIARR